MTFNWVATSNPVGVTYDPSSGSLAPGETSSTITATDNSFCPVVFEFIDQGHNVGIQSNFDGACQRG
jgi:hypothetical protein